MAGFASLAAVQAALAAGQRFDRYISKDYYIGEDSNSWQSHWATTGSPAAGGFTSGALTNAGGLILPDTSPASKHLLTWGMINVLSSNYDANFVLYDRLVQVGGVSVASTGVKTVNTATLPRYTSGVDVQVWLEITTDTSTTAPAVTLSSYTDNTGTSGLTGPSYLFAPGSGSFNSSYLAGPLPLAAGSKGVKSVEQITVDTAAAAGAVAVVLLKPIAAQDVSGRDWNEHDFIGQQMGLPRIYDGASLGLMIRVGGSSIGPQIIGNLAFVYG